jgi:hypothetical protein
MGEIHYCRPLYDPEGALESLKNVANNYPPRLKRALIRGQLWEVRFALDTCRKPAARGDAIYVTGCLFRRAACMVQVLFALNERYLRAVPHQRKRLRRGRRFSTSVSHALQTDHQLRARATRRTSQAARNQR